jgi:hypothetical protein
MNDHTSLGYLRDFADRLRTAWAWIGAQFVGIGILLLAILAWTRVPDKFAWQVLSSLLIPVLMFACLLLLQAGTMRKLLGRSERNSTLATGTLTLVLWAVVIWIAWWFLDWCSDHVIGWASYLNSRASAGSRSRLFTFDHLQQWLTWIIWFCRWIALPAKVLPHAMASAQWGWRFPLRKSIGVVLDWRWWPAAIIAAFVGIALPGHFFTAVPGGTVSHQVWTVILKVAGAFVLALGAWNLLLAWCAVLLAREVGPVEETVPEFSGQPLNQQSAQALSSELGSDASGDA